METTIYILSICLWSFLGIGGIYVTYRAFGDDRKALASGMMRPKIGFSVQLTNDSIKVFYLNELRSSLAIEEITGTEYIRDNCFDKITGIESAVKLFRDSNCVAHIGESTENFTQLLKWAREHPNHKVTEVELCS